MATKLIRSISNIPPQAKGGIVTIGNFDGVHLGHRKLINKVLEVAKTFQVPAVVITFEPHPFEFFKQENLTTPRLTRLREKFIALRKLGVDFVLVLPFNQSLADLSASDFAAKILSEKLAAKHIIIGDDFHFGRNRQGNFELLQTLESSLGFGVEAMPTIIVDGDRVSSTRVRQALGQGDLLQAENLLGRPYTMSGRVGRGDQRGREFGFPTANIFLQRKLTPVKGVFTVLMHGITANPLPGVANVGVRPTVDGTRTLLEVHLLDFNQDIYGRYVEVEFCEKLRDEERYANLDLLKAQIAKDVTAAQNYFIKHGAL